MHSLHNFPSRPHSLELQLSGSLVVLTQPQLFRERRATVRRELLLPHNQHLRLGEGREKEGGRRKGEGEGEGEGGKGGGRWERREGRREMGEKGTNLQLQ